MRENLLFESCGARTSDNELQSTKRGINLNIELKRQKTTKHSVKLMYSLLEGKRHQSLAKPDELTELAKHISGKLQGVKLSGETMQTYMCDL